MDIIYDVAMRQGVPVHYGPWRNTTRRAVI